MAKIKIKDLCFQLKNDIDEKSLFFKELSASEFLVPFQKEGIFNLTDNASYWVVQYLQRIYNEDTKDKILEIINSNIEESSITDISYSTYYQLVILLDMFEIMDLNNLNYKKLLEHNNSIELVQCIYKKREIINHTDLNLATISSLLKYEIGISSLEKKGKISYETYYLSELINSDATKENFEIALTQEFVFDLLLEKYNEVYFKTHEYKNDISDVFSRQTIDMEEMKASFVNDYTTNDVSNIILFFMCVNLKSNNSDAYCKIKKLLAEEIYMLRKLGLYFIYLNLDKYIDLLKVFFENINRRNIIKVINICLYELVKIFTDISKVNGYQNFNDDIKEFLQKFPKKYETDKYDVLHGLKEHLEFKSMFNELKEKYQYEKENPGIFWQSGVGGWVRHVSPISEKEFRSKSIAAQISYINLERKYEHHLVQLDDECVEEVNEYGLIDLFKKVVSEDINYYLDDDNILILNKKEFIKAFLEIMSQNIDKIDSINKVILFIDSNLYNIFEDTKIYSGLLHELIDFNIGIADKRHKDFKKIFKYIEQISQYDYDESYYKDETDVSFVALNTTHGRNFRCYVGHLTKIRKLSNKDKTFLSYILQENNEEKFCTFYYYLGMQYQYLINKFKELNLLERINKLNDIARSYFLNGYLAYFCYIPQFRDLKSLILKSFASNEIKEGQVRTRFVRMLLDLKLRFNEDNIFKEFSQYFSEKDYEDILNNLTYRDNPNYSKQMVMRFWNNIVKIKNKTFTSSLIAIFNRHCDTNDIEQYSEQLKNIIKLGLPESLVVNRSIKRFLEKMLCYLRVSQNSVITYDILETIISSMKDVKYLHGEFDIIKDILNEFKNQNKLINAKLIAGKMYDIPCLKFYATEYKEFLT